MALSEDAKKYRKKAITLQHTVDKHARTIKTLREQQVELVEQSKKSSTEVTLLRARVADLERLASAQEAHIATLKGYAAGQEDDT